MDKTIDTPSREIDLGNIPVHLRTALRRALEFEARAPAPRSAEEAEQCEEQLRVIADEFFGALLTPVLQRAVCSAAVGDAASALVRHLPRRMRSDGLETVNVRTSRGTTVPVTTPYYREKHARRAKRRPGLYPALVVLGIYDRCTPKLASDASRAVAMHSSLAEAQAQLRSEGIALDIKTLRSTAYRYAARARAAQQSAACGLLDRVTGKRVVVSLDGGRVRVRRKKRGPKTKKGRNRFHTDWKEPKLLILYVVGDDGRPSQTWAPIIDGTLRGPEAVFALLLSYARQIGLNAADKVLFIADGAPWIWRRLQRLIAALGLSPTQVLGLIDFYHAAKQLSDAVKLRRWSATQRTRWLNRTRGLLKRARVDEVITALRELCRGRTAGKIRTHLNYFLKNRHRFAYTTMVGLGLPRGSGAVESAIRRVINLRIKGASIYWLPESVDAILLRVRLFFVEEFLPYSWAFLPADASLQCSFRGDSNQASAYPRRSGGQPSLETAPNTVGLSPSGALPSGHSRGVLVRFHGQGDRPVMAVTTGFQGRRFDVPEARTGVPRIDLPSPAPCAAADAVFADAKAFLSSNEARQMSESELERELHRRGQKLVRKLLQGHHDQRSPGQAAGPAEDASGVECSARREHDSHAETTSGNDAGCGSGLRAARSRRPASARCRAEPAAGALLGRYAPPRDHRDRFAGTTAYALEATVVLDIIHVAAAMRRAVLVASSLKACRHSARDRMGVDRRTVTLGCSCDGPQAATGRRRIDAY